ncbi:MAG TPA: 4-hydroxy-tetrahydrodipicolinate reductase [bacterium]|nr:4-hydroxy-tetrahydrodipicolinate reductase [Candidatus Omnitrophota bacterium]HOJ59472.1 4-hydroxy-tetrahydrodipicolinate reductase [bacterium]HOL94759.1 4-hydroxy-tetrahydrodipicolinate reductase [bacterium]HPP00620.1 4-hydroxy-tetrahydrodipicolinate reductase [bacterium]HXK92205.1 4-hydroxy-tetrahydrodipicolinate reductase [bacterium]
MLVLVNGARGKMGKESVRAVREAEDMELVAETDVEDVLADAIRDSGAQVVVDFTTPHCAFQNALTIVETGVGGVIGTTGFTPDQIDELEIKCAGKHPGLLIAPNFAIGAVLMMHCARIIARHMPDVEIIELHHPAKLDAPSGTAIKTAELIAQSQARTIVPRGTSEPAARGDRFHGIPVHSVRLPGLLAHQSIIFGAEGQTLTVRHDSINRSCFMPGVLLGIREVLHRKGLIYGLESLLLTE